MTATFESFGFFRCRYIQTSHSVNRDVIGIKRLCNACQSREVQDIELALEFYKTRIRDDYKLIQNAITQFNRFDILIHRENQLSI